jgi:hypothetical protein
MENPHRSLTWGGWGFIEAYLEARDAHLTRDDCRDDEYPSPLDSDYDEEYSGDNDHPTLIRRTGHRTFVTRVGDEDDETSDTENESEVSTERIDTPRSMYAVTATEPADFFKEYWQTQEYAGERQFEDYDDWFCEDYDVYDADRDDNADDNDDHEDNAHDSDDKQIFCLGD